MPVRISSVTQMCSAVCNPMNHSIPASLSITNSQSPPKPMSIELVMPSNQLILCHPLFLLPSIFPSIRVFSDESALHIRWPKYWSFSLKISPGCSLEGVILKLKLQCFGHLMQKADLFEKTLMLGKVEGRRRRGREDEMVGWHHRLDGHEFE